MRCSTENQIRFTVEGKVLQCVDSFHIQREDGSLINVSEKIRKIVRESIKPASQMRISIKIEWEVKK